MGIRDALERYSEKKRKLKSYEDELRMRKTAEDRMKTSQERDLEDYLEKQRQERIREQVRIHKQIERKKFWASPYKQNLQPQRNGISLRGGFLGGKCL